MGDRRLVGVDLGISSAHTVRVLAGDGSVVCRRKAVPTVASLVGVERAALQGATPRTRLGGCWSRPGLLAADRGVLHQPRAHRLPCQLGQGA
jgi:hypothetical protein